MQYSNLGKPIASEHVKKCRAPFGTVFKTAKLDPNLSHTCRIQALVSYQLILLKHYDLFFTNTVDL
jgi:hypothetical protein